ncbi:MAG TPA: hypothetical protein P5298_08040, partial [Spirochaetia bacterium]|nr:hypothetical protein [Spirochaetia bacterium]
RVVESQTHAVLLSRYASNSNLGEENTSKRGIQEKPAWENGKDEIILSPGLILFPVSYSLILFVQFVNT